MSCFRSPTYDRAGAGCELAQGAFDGDGLLLVLAVEVGADHGEEEAA
jgi:hypothetical protein